MKHVAYISLQIISITDILCIPDDGPVVQNISSIWNHKIFHFVKPLNETLLCHTKLIFFFVEIVEVHHDEM